MIIKRKSIKRKSMKKKKQLKRKTKRKSTKKSKKTQKGGNKSQILYLTHITRLSNIENILKSKKIFTDYERFLHKTPYEGIMNDTPEYGKKYMIDMHEFPGIYLSFITKDHIDNYISYWGEDNIILVFGKELLNQKNYHANIIDSNGRIAENLTYFPHNIDKMPNMKEVIKYYEDEYDDYPGNEIIFHNGIPTNLISEIWVNNKDTKNKLINILKKNNLKEYVDLVSVVTKYPNKTIHIPNNKLQYLDKSLPFFTYYLDNGTTGYYKKYYPCKNKTKSSKTFLEKIAKIARLEDNMKNIDREELVKKFNRKRINKMDIPNYYFLNRDKQNLKILDNDFYN